MDSITINYVTEGTASIRLAGKAILTKLRTKQTLDSNEEILFGISFKPSFGTAGVLKSVIIVNT